ncbi:hypothetical protein RYZ26_08970 [Terasakiella sp. A23]|uniref:hypothetical protein n=1 Tax=Terasakiella sp. FCG-A23 TaxID=3080561 RepID=UPI002953F88B|nr:hypothetical protein [Terasakiella sp. A23]MDV7339723.1 hypothetical protein [Terasakiella sp. A23]
MIRLRPLFFGLTGASRLLRLDISGMHLMVGGARGFWHSLFWSAGLVAPLYILLLLLRYDPEKFDGWRYILVHAEMYVIAWLVFPIVMLRICQLIRRPEQYLKFIIGYNWLNCFTNTFFLLAALAQASRMIEWDAAIPIFGCLLMVSFIWLGHLIKHALELPYSAAVGIVILDFFIGLMTDLVKTGLLAS